MAGECLPIAVTDYFVKQLIEIAKQTAKLSLAAIGSISDMKDLSAKDIASAASKAAGSYIVALGEDYVLELMRSQIKKLLDDTFEEHPEILRTVESARNYSELAMGTLAMVCNIQTGSILYLVQKMCDRIRTRIEEKEYYLAKIRTNVQNINEAMKKIAVERLPWFDEFGQNMELAVDKIIEAQEKLNYVYVKLTKEDVFPSNRWDESKVLVREAAGLLGPEETKSFNVDLPAQLMAIITIPKETAELASNIAQYLLKANEINGLVEGIINFEDSVKSAGGTFLNSWQAKLVASIILELRDFEIELGRIISRKNMIETALVTMPMALRLEAISYKMDFSLAKASEYLNDQQDEYKAYVEMVHKLCQRMVLNGGVYEEACDPLADNLEVLNQCTTLVKVANLFIVKDYPGWEDVVKNCLEAIDDSYEIDGKIKAAISGFQMAENPLIEQALNILEAFGLDKARDALLNGDIAGYFGMTVDYASYAGIAIACLRSSMEEAEDVETRNRLGELLNKTIGSWELKGVSVGNAMKGITEKLASLNVEKAAIVSFQAMIDTVYSNFQKAP